MTSGGNPDFNCQRIDIQHVASHFIDSHSEAGGIALAIGIIRNWAAGKPSGGEKKVHPDTVAAAQKALDEWEALKAKAKTVKSTKHFADDSPAVELASANISQGQRDKMQSQGATMNDGSFPIPSVKFLRKAIQSFGRCPPDKRDALVAHIRAKAKALGASDLPWVKNFVQAHSAGGSRS